MEQMKKIGSTFSIITIVATAFAGSIGGGIIGASFKAGTEQQAVADNTVRIGTVEQKIERLVGEDTAQKKDIAALQAQLATLAPLMKEIADQHRQMLGELSEIRGEVTVILKQMPVSTLKMEPKNITRKH